MNAKTWKHEAWHSAWNIHLDRKYKLSWRCRPWSSHKLIVLVLLDWQVWVLMWLVNKACWRTPWRFSGSPLQCSSEHLQCVRGNRRGKAAWSIKGRRVSVWGSCMYKGPMNRKPARSTRGLQFCYGSSGPIGQFAGTIAVLYESNGQGWSDHKIRRPGAHKMWEGWEGVRLYSPK